MNAAQLWRPPVLQLPPSSSPSWPRQLRDTTELQEVLGRRGASLASIARRKVSLPLIGSTAFLGIRVLRPSATARRVESGGRIRPSRKRPANRPALGFLQEARWERLRRKIAALFLAFAVVAAAWGASLSHSRAAIFQSRLDRGGQVEFVYNEATPFRKALNAVGIIPSDGVAMPSEIPSPWHDGGGFVSDTAHLLESSTIRQINSMARDIRQKTGAEVVVVTVKRVRGAKEDRTLIKRFATDLFNSWGLGDRYKNNGVLVLVDIGDRRVEVEIGAGLNVVFKRDEWLRRMIDTSILPALRHRDVDRGVLAGVQSCCQKLMDTDREVSSPQRLQHRAWFLWGASGISAWLAAGVALGWTFAKPPKCSRCGGRMIRLREAEDEELADGQKAERRISSAQHLLCVCNRPGCKSTWSRKAPVKQLGGAQRLGGVVGRTRDLKLTADEVKEAAERNSAVAILATRRWLSRYRTCPCCGYTTLLSRTMVIGGLRITETECFFCNAYTYDEAPTFTVRERLGSYDNSNADDGDSTWSGGGGGFSDGGGDGGDF